MPRCSGRFQVGSENRSVPFSDAVEKRIKATPHMLELEEKDATGLVGKVKK